MAGNQVKHLWRASEAAVLLLLMFMYDAAALTQTYQDACREYAGRPKVCMSMLSSSGLENRDVSMGTPGRFQLVSSALRSVLEGVNEEILISRKLGGALLPLRGGGQTLVTTEEKKNALNDCVEMLVRASELVGDSINTRLGNVSSSSSLEDVHTWMSAALTYQETCLEGLSQIPPHKEAVIQLKQEGDKVAARISTALSFIVTLVGGVDNAALTSWVPELLTKPKPRKKAVSANAVVAQDGSGQYSSIQDAVDAAPSKSSSTYVIYIKEGTYKEKVSVSKSKTNLMFVGDGIGKTIITGSRSVQDGVTTFKTATVEINGRGFLGRDLTIQNTAGSNKHQAVALRVSADKVAFYKSSFEGYQDTLYTHVMRQFYRECVIYGTVDYIFGNSAAVFQSCSLIARVPMDKQKNTLTAQGRSDRNQNTGLVFQDCNIDGTSDLKSTGTPTFLGRPWQKFSRTVFMRCYEGSVIAPAGWLEWSGSFALSTLYYAEYECKGPGFQAGKRVGWSSQMTSSSEASSYTPGSFISGSDWLGGTSFPYALGL